MKKKFPANIEQYRVRTGPMKSDSSFGFNGFFRIPYGDEYLRVMISDGADWDHVSVSLGYRTPSWTEMHWIKRLFWDDSETVIQIHPPENKYVNRCQYCLHLWKHQLSEIKLPPIGFVG